MKDLRERDVREESTPHLPFHFVDQPCSLAAVARDLAGPGAQAVETSQAMNMSRSIAAAAICVFLVAATWAEDAYAVGTTPSAPIRVVDVIDGHVHPSVCVTHSGDVLAVYNKSGGGGKELLLCRSRDRGRIWSAPVPIPVIKDCSIYPGSLTTLRDGRIVLHWSCYRHEGERRWRVPQYCVSENEGKSWSNPRDLRIDDHTNYSCLRHSILELDENRWVCPLYVSVT